MKKIRIFLLIFFWIISHQSLAADITAGSSGFQRYFANMRLCLFSEKIESCLPSKVDNIVSKPADDYARDQFVNLVKSDLDFRENVSGCFLQSAQIITEWDSIKLFRSAEYACEVRKINGKWKLTAFYNFISQE